LKFEFKFQIRHYWFIPLFESFARTWKPTINCVHLNMKLFNVYFLDCDFTKNETNNHWYTIVSKLLTSIIFNKLIRYRVILVNTVDFDFEQYQYTILKLNFARFVCRLISVYEDRLLPNIDCLHQIPLFSQLKIIYSSSNATICRTILNNP